MSVLRMAPACVRAVVNARDTLHSGGWSLDTIADDIDVDQRWVAAPSSIYGLVVVEANRAIVTTAEHIRGTEQEMVIRGRLLAEVLGVRADGLSFPYANVCKRSAWRHDITRRPLWAAGQMLAVSLADVAEMISGESTPAEIGMRRGLPGWLAELRITQETMYGTIDGDSSAALCRAVQVGDTILAWIGKAGSYQGSLHE